MGWTFIRHSTRADIIERLRKDISPNATMRRSTAIGNSFWALVEVNDGRVLVFHSIMQGGTKDYPGWGYKDLSHRDGVDCPVDYLRFLPDTEDVREQAWREAVREHHRKTSAVRKMRKGLKPGVELTLAGKTYQLVESLGTRGWEVRCLEDGGHYRMPTKHITRAITQALKREAEST
ncbi:hypothetical protein [Paraburkholderia sp. A3RO-2L]|jgi:hypothetical protein|uniref:hypothetical protein n=1 Tax=Paraburkholderia sp. A3RO-2L TaxID=3028376 RepID=UPI003DA9D3BC